MISFKVLIILTVIFYIITYCNGGKKETEEKVLNFIKKFKETEETKETEEFKDYKNCVDILTKFGFKNDSGYYNLLYVMQFYNPDNDMIFLNHVKSMLDISGIDYKKSSEKIDLSRISTEKEFMDKYNIRIMIDKNHTINSMRRMNGHRNISTASVTLVDATSTISNEDQTKIHMAEFIDSFYKDASKVDYRDWKIWMSPLQFCTIDLYKRKGKSNFFKEIIEKFTLDSEDQLIKFANIEKNKKLIEECKNSVLKFEAVINNNEYKYDENNIFKCVKTSMDLEKQIIEVVKKLMDLEIKSKDFKYNEPNIFRCVINSMNLDKLQNVEKLINSKIESKDFKYNEKQIIEVVKKLMDLENTDKKFEYNKNNIFRCVITSMHLDSYGKDLKDIEINNEKNTFGCVNKLMDLEYCMFTISSLCQIYVYEKNY